MSLRVRPSATGRVTSVTDSALIIDAMDLLHGGTVDGFCLVSSDSDFTRLAAVTKAQPAVTKAKRVLKGDTKLDKLLSEAVETAADDDGWAHLGAVGSNLSRLSSDFDSRSWGFAKLTDLLKAHPGFDVQSRSPGDGKPKVSVVRSKPRK